MFGFFRRATAADHEVIGIGDDVGLEALLMTQLLPPQHERFRARPADEPAVAALRFSEQPVSWRVPASAHGRRG